MRSPYNRLTAIRVMTVFTSNHKSVPEILCSQLALLHRMTKKKLETGD